MEEKVVTPVQKAENKAVGICHAEHVEQTSPTSGSCSVGRVCSRTQVMEFSLV
jgi:hypothetical protein